MRRSSKYLLWLLPTLFLFGCGSDKVVFSTAPLRIAFASERTGLQQAYVTDTHGLSIIQISHTAGRAYSPRWAPHVDRLVFSGTDSTDDRSDIFTVAPDGTGQVNLTHSPGVFDAEPAWSPDGAYIVFVSDRDLDDEIYVMRSDGTDAKRLTTTPLIDWRPLWSPKGDWIAFSSARSGNDSSDIYVMRPDGSDQRRLTQSYSAEYDPVWSPDGSAIAFCGGNIDTTQIYRVTLDGSSPMPLTDSDHSVEEPSWSPDGATIAYAASDGIHIMARDGSGDQPIPGTTRFDRSPVWSTDGGNIAFVNTENNNHEVFIMGTDGSGRTNLSKSMYHDTTPAWEPLP
jgi:Tol biopolymer transport system component